MYECVLWDRDFKYCILEHLRNTLPPCFKDSGRQDKCRHISNTTSHGAIILTLLDSLVDSDDNGYIVDRVSYM